MKTFTVISPTFSGSNSLNQLANPDCKYDLKRDLKNIKADACYFLKNNKRKGYFMNKLLPYSENPIEIPANKPQRFKDELNFAEFPLGSLADSVATETKSLIFTDTIFDQGTNQPVTRKLTISPSSEYGLPRALDEEVILGLIQLSNRDGFNDRKVHFSSYELIKLLGWSDSTKSYKRIEEALKRWVGVTLYYDKAWWSKEERSWVSEHFHVIESVTTYDRERKAQRKKLKLEDPNAARSYFVWSDQVFQSFRAGNLKEIDLRITES